MTCLNCRNCPYGTEDFERRMNWYEKIVSEQGIPNDIYGSLESDDAADEFEQFLWCDKVGGKVYCFGHCEDAYSDTDILDETIHSKQKHRNKRERDRNYKRHLKTLADNIPYYPEPAMLVETESKAYYKRLYRGKRFKYLKKVSNKIHIKKKNSAILS